MIYCKRVYDAVSSEDGYRVLVDRLWPRGIKKVALDYDEWNKDVAPSNELRKWFHQHPDQFNKFVEDYHQELSHHSAAWMPLVEKAKLGNLTLLYSAKDKVHNQAHVLKAYLERCIKSQE
ncbi:DUF488 domain-containing protein [Providencia stuartii]|uniref:MarR family transcriptional regulator n=1 Tax=Providencia stuartii (strain MRSN 2154) TaxID=1157951 RepID=A0A140NJR1_PROSM|nr:MULTISPECIES: DUF488 family protein [Providencia]SST03968.1 putative uroporphyrin-III C-methyltransferase [Acinetobacter baumannii]AFH93719.1 hypothetical protein S70_09295 [Providencia stuartii MRSN 2154]KSX93000.1 MarR family transcriptional regulator [Providencia stuartii]MCX3070086.1 DUF488 family protein [Providencia stuartii]MDE8747725.1 DUF488 family protein [Providencia thailandensis]